MASKSLNLFSIEEICIRINEFIQYLGISQNEFGKQVGFSSGLMSILKKGKTSFGVDKLIKILSRFPELSPEWLLTGKGNMLKSVSPVFEKITIGQKFNGEAVINAVKNVDNLLPLPEKISAAPQNSIDTTYIERLQSFGLMGYTAGRSFKVFEIEGDSMHPTLWPSDIVICSCVAKPENICEGFIFMIITNENQKFPKRIKKDGENLTLLSDNKNYSPLKLPLSEIAEIWQVHALITRQIPAPDRKTEQLQQLENRLSEIEQSLKN